MKRPIRALLGLAVTAAMAGLLVACAKSPAGPSPSGLVVAGVSPNAGPTAPGTALRVIGAGFLAGATLTFDGIATNATVVSGSMLTATAPAHAAGPVDIVVTNPSGEIARLTKGFTYERLTIRAISPNAGTSEGQTFVVITGGRIQPGAAVTIGGVTTRPIFPQASGVGMFTGVHAAGIVDVVVTNPNGESETLSGGYTYVSPESFDFNGAWDADAYPNAASENSTFHFTFTIQNNVLTQVSCSVGPIPLSPTPLTTNRSFTASREGVNIAGQMTDVGFATGSLHVPACGQAEYWDGSKRPSSVLSTAGLGRHRG